MFDDLFIFDEALGKNDIEELYAAEYDIKKLYAEYDNSIRSKKIYGVYNYNNETRYLLIDL